jgi:thiol-disulfide isomerase/thioredoxin
VLWSCLAAAGVAGLLIAVLAFSSPASNGGLSGRLVGQPAPPVSGPALLGPPATLSLASESGRWVLVNFAASWCVPCRQETPELQRLAASGRADVLAVAFDPSDVSSLTAYLRAARVTWLAVNDPAAEVAYGVTQIPRSFLVDPAGRVVAEFSGPVTAAQVVRAQARASA